MLDVLFVVLVFGLVDFVYMCINGCQYMGGVGFVSGVLCYGGQCGNVNYWQFGVQCQFLGDIDVDVYVGKVVWIVVKGQCVQFVQCGVVFGEDFLYQWQDMLGMFVGINFEMSIKGVIILQSCGVGFCGGIDS